MNVIVKIGEVGDGDGDEDAAKAGVISPTPNLSTYIHHFNFHLLIISKPIVTTSLIRYYY